MSFFKYYAENKAERLIPDFFLCFKEALCEVKASALELSFNLLKTNYIKPEIDIDPGICSIFELLQKGLGIVSPPGTVYDFSRKMFLRLYSIKSPDFIARYWPICILQLFVKQLVTP